MGEIIVNFNYGEYLIQPEDLKDLISIARRAKKVMQSKYSGPHRMAEPADDKHFISSIFFSQGPVLPALEDEIPEEDQGNG